MKFPVLRLALAWLGWATVFATRASAAGAPVFEKRAGELALVVPLDRGALNLSGFFYETKDGRANLPAAVIPGVHDGTTEGDIEMPDGRTVRVSVRPGGDGRSEITLSANPADGILKWGFSVDADSDEYFTGLMERTVDGSQTTSWQPGLKTALNLHGQKIELVVKPSTAVYAPFYLSSRGYGIFVRTDWPGAYDFCASDPHRVKIEFEGPALAFAVYTASSPAAIVRAHALEAGPPVLPPRWVYSPWRWRDEVTPRTSYYDGTKATGPFNTEFMEDVLMMRAYGIPCGVYLLDRPWGPGPLGYDDFAIDEKRLPNFTASVQWLEEQKIKTVLWLGVFLQGHMQEEGLAKRYTLAGQQRRPDGQNYPMVDLSNPAAKAYWQSGVEKLLRLGVAGFKLDRGEQDLPESRELIRHDGKTMRENRNTYVASYAQAAAEVARKNREEDFVTIARGAYTGSATAAVFWGGDVAGTPEGLRASIIAVQRAAVMGYPNWGSDTGGYSRQTFDHDLWGRWLEFSCFTPIMEVGPTGNVGLWNLPRAPAYDAELIAIWRLYARLHERLAGYSHAQARVAAQTGMPIVRPIFLADPATPTAWNQWSTYEYGPDLVVAPIWQKGRREQEIYLPAGDRWRDVWHDGKVFDGGQVLKVDAALHQIPLFAREGSAVIDLLGDLPKEWREAVEAAGRRPDLTALEATALAWFEQWSRTHDQN